MNRSRPYSGPPPGSPEAVAGLRWRIEAKGTAREVYVIDAESRDHARRLFEAGDVPAPLVSEVVDAEVESITEVEEE